MSNLISHPEQCQAVNLDTVVSVFHQAGISKKIWFSYPAISIDSELEVTWEFKTKEEAGIVYNKILDRFVTEIN
jgi:hypothetical protein